MTFYLRPPEGTIPIHLFQLYAESRLKFLITMAKNPNVTTEDIMRENILEIPRLDSVMEGSTKDCVSHFSLRSIAILHPDIMSFIEYSEKQLFNRRLRNYKSDKNIDSTVRKLLRQLHHYVPFLDKISKSVKSKAQAMRLDRHAEFLRTTSKILLEIVKKRLSGCYQSLSSSCSVHGSKIVLTIPFTQVLDLMSMLEVTLVNGQAQFQCHKIYDYYEVIFEKLLQISIEVMKSTDCWDKIQYDSRFHEGGVKLRRILESQGCITQKYGINFLSNTPLISVKSIKLEMLDNFMYKFPPCMSNMYRHLRQHHRLCHHPRVQFTLFLKSIGLNIDDTLFLLREEYSKPTATLVSSDNNEGKIHKCEHSWQKDSRRYIYGTRHLYGLEGARKKYSSHTCLTIQNSATFSSCGGCPFLFHERKQLKVLGADLKNESIAKEFLGSIENSDSVTPIEICHEYLCFKVNQRKSLVASDACQSETLQNCSSSSTSNRTCKIVTKGNNEAKRIVMLSKPTHFYRIIK